MGIKVKDYILEIDRKKQEAFENDKTQLVIRAGDLHSELGTKGSPTLIQCCSAMKQCMLEGDEIIFTKENKSGVSSSLTIKYNVIDMTNRKSINSVKKRGRPAGRKNTHSSEDKKIADTQEVNLCIENWMRKERMRFDIQEDHYLVNDSYGLWVIPKYIDTCESDNFLRSIRLLSDEHYKCSVIFKDTKESRLFWNTMSESVIDRLNMTALFVSRNKNVLQAD